MRFYLLGLVPVIDEIGDGCDGWYGDRHPGWHRFFQPARPSGSDDAQSSPRKQPDIKGHRA
jgi:hypothetical protein